MPSNPMKSEKTALINMIAMTKMNCITESEYRRRNQRVSLGMSITMVIQNSRSLATNHSQNKKPPLPFTELTMAASVMRQISSENIDEPTLRVDVA